MLQFMRAPAIASSLAAYLVIGAVLSAGCSRADFGCPTGTLSGTVDLPDEIEADGLLIHFRNDLTGHTFAAELGADGRFSVSHGPKRSPRVPVGRYLYSLSAVIEDPVMTPEEQTRALLDAESAFTSSASTEQVELLRDYGQFKQSRKIDVNEGANDFAISISGFGTEKK